MRITTRDNDFTDVDLVQQNSSSLAIVLHGLEGSSYSSYMRGMVRALANASFDVAAKNFRGCSGHPNLKPYSYHSGSSSDLSDVVHHFIDDPRFDYQSIYLVGFSLGGNVLLKYLGEISEQAPTQIKGAVAISVPIDLESCAEKLASLSNRIYMKRFLRMLKEKMAIKAEMFPDTLSIQGFESLKTFADFDGRYVAPLHGFKDARDYWRKSSSLPLLSRISVPTLLLNAQDDPFLTPHCFPDEESKKNRFFFLEAPSRGGHVGFYRHPWERFYYSEKRTVQFLLTCAQELQSPEDRVPLQASSL